MAKKSDISFEELISLMRAWCATREVCRSEARLKMKKWNIGDPDIEKAIKLLEEDRYIDEKRYANAFANDKLTLNKWGPNKVKQALLIKGISEQYITEAINEKKKETNQGNIVKELLEKKLKSFKNGLTNHEVYAKLMRFGLSRGFDYEIVSKYARELVHSIET